MCTLSEIDVQLRRRSALRLAAILFLSHVSLFTTSALGAFSTFTAGLKQASALLVLTHSLATCLSFLDLGVGGDLVRGLLVYNSIGAYADCI